MSRGQITLRIPPSLRWRGAAPRSPRRSPRKTRARGGRRFPQKSRQKPFPEPPFPPDLESRSEYTPRPPPRCAPSETRKGRCRPAGLDKPAPPRIERQSEEAPPGRPGRWFPTWPNRRGRGDGSREGSIGPGEGKGAPAPRPPSPRERKERISWPAVRGPEASPERVGQQPATAPSHPQLPPAQAAPRLPAQMRRSARQGPESQGPVWRSEVAARPAPPRPSFWTLPPVAISPMLD